MSGVSLRPLMRPETSEMRVLCDHLYLFFGKTNMLQFPEDDTFLMLKRIIVNYIRRRKGYGSAKASIGRTGARHFQRGTGRV